MYRIPARLGALLAAGLLAFVAMGCSSSSGSAATPPPTSAADPSSSGGAGEATDLDRAFIDMMVPHHQSAVEMAKVAQERAEHEELRTLASDIITAQDGEIADLKSWRKAWFGSDETPAMDEMPLVPGMEMPGMEGHGMGGTMDMTAEVEELRTADPFDAAFLDSMIEHHQSAIAAAELVQDQAGRPEVRQVAADIIAAQQREIDQMEAWRTEWYPG